MREVACRKTARDRAAERVEQARRTLLEFRDRRAERRRRGRAAAPVRAAELQREQAYAARQARREAALESALETARRASTRAEDALVEARRALEEAVANRAAAGRHEEKWRKAEKRKQLKLQENEREEQVRAKKPAPP